MEGLAPSIRCVLDLERSLECGVSMRSAVYQWVQSSQNDFVEDVRALVIAHDAGQSLPTYNIRCSQERRAVLDLIWRGLCGEPVLAQFRALRDEIELAASLELDEFMVRLPMRALVPLLLFIFPGFMVLLFGPLLKTLMKGFMQ
jgi:hypothetical protein